MLSESVTLTIFTHELRIRWGCKSEIVSFLMKGNKSRVHFVPFVIKAIEKKVSREINVFVSLHDAMTSKTEVKMVP